MTNVVSSVVSRREIEALIPHQGAMCLLAGATHWDAERIVCHADNHRRADHPLRSRRGLLSTCLIEYAAQAMALHGALLARSAADGPPRAQPGLLAAARQLEFELLNLDDLPRAAPDTLHVEARCEARDATQLRYVFAAHHAGARLASGRITVVLGAAPGAAPDAAPGAAA
jgi:predicted hotdog family 3-hydroxylacyl-ACP dehydratase